MTALNAKTENSDGSERQTENNDGSEHQNWKAMMALNAKTEKPWWLWTPKLKIVMALNAKTEKRQWLWTPKLESDDGSERQTKQNMAPNVGTNDVMALNAEREYDSECQFEQ